MVAIRSGATLRAATGTESTSVSMPSLAETSAEEPSPRRIVVRPYSVGRRPLTVRILAIGNNS